MRGYHFQIEKLQWHHCIYSICSHNKILLIILLVFISNYIILIRRVFGWVSTHFILRVSYQTPWNHHKTLVFLIILIDCSGLAWKYQNKMRNLFKVNNKDIRTKSVSSLLPFHPFFRCSCCYFEQVNACWIQLTIWWRSLLHYTDKASVSTSTFFTVHPVLYSLWYIIHDWRVNALHNRNGVNTSYINM